MRSFSCATTDPLKSKLSEYNLDQCKPILLHVGGNDADNGTDLETFAEKYETLITDMMTMVVENYCVRVAAQKNCRHDRLKSLCGAYEMEYIDKCISRVIRSIWTILA